MVSPVRSLNSHILVGPKDFEIINMIGFCTVAIKRDPRRVDRFCTGLSPKSTVWEAAGLPRLRKCTPSRIRRNRAEPSESGRLPKRQRLEGLGLHVWGPAAAVETKWEETAGTIWDSEGS